MFISVGVRWFLWVNFQKRFSYVNAHLVGLWLLCAHSHETAVLLLGSFKQ